MKKALFVLLIAVTCVFSSCAKGGSNDVGTDEQGSKPNAPGAFTSDLTDPFSSSDKEVDYKGYFQIVRMREGTSDEFGQGTYYLAVKNNTTSPLYIEALITAKDSSGNILKREEAEFPCVGSNEVSFNYVIFDARYSDPFDSEYPGPTDADKIADVEVELQYIPNSEIDYYDDIEPKPIVSSLEVKKYENKDKRNVVITAKNHGEYNAYMPEAHVLFFDKNNNVVGHQSVLFTDEDLELKSGDTQFGEANFYGNYDHTEVFISGYSGGSTKKHADTITEKDIEIVKEINVSYSGENVNTYVMRYLIIKNNSAVDAEIELRSVAWDKGNHALAAGYGGVDILGPGQTTICQVMYSEIFPDEIDRIDDVFFFKTENLYYTDILDSLSYEIAKTDGGVVLSVTNNGIETAQGVEAYVFFYDNSGSLVGCDHKFVTDDDLEIKPGATEKETIENSEGTPFDSVEVYLSGKSEFKS